MCAAPRGFNETASSSPQGLWLGGGAGRKSRTSVLSWRRARVSRIFSRELAVGLLFWNFLRAAWDVYSSSAGVGGGDGNGVARARLVCMYNWVGELKGEGG